MSHDWSPEQARALDEVGRWLKTRGRDRQVFRLFGYAGTGKTTLARHLAEGVDGNVVFAAYTGKAALVMQSRGCVNARTIHSLIYRPKEIDSEEPSFVLNSDSEAADAKLIVIDECSMVDEELGRDLLSFGRPVLVLGDPAQLPPVKGGGYFTEAEPDVMLSEVHRQAAGDPIVRLSMIVREGGRPQIGDYGSTRVIRRDDTSIPPRSSPPTRCSSASIATGGSTTSASGNCSTAPPHARARRQARVPAQRPGQGPAQRRRLARADGGRRA